MFGKWYESTCIKIEAVNDTVRRFWLRLPVEAVAFKAGQFVTLDLPISQRRTQRWRSYSIASAVADVAIAPNVIELVIVRLENGAGTTYLFDQFKEGDVVKVREPQGQFVLNEAHLQEELCFVCTGTGVAPFRSMLREISAKKLVDAPMHLIFGTRYEEGLLYRAEFEALAAANENFHYYPVLSRASAADWTGHRGYVHAVYEELFRDKRPANFYLCGWNIMLDEAKERLKNMGYTPQQIIMESYG